MSPLNRRHFLTGGALLAVSGVLAACSNPENKTDGTPSEVPESTTSGATSATGSSSANAGTSSTGAPAFPVTIQDRYGSVTIPAMPKRIFALGTNDHDVLFALGVDPIAVVRDDSEAGSPRTPWNQEMFDRANPTIIDISGDKPWEAIAALNPDLILAVNQNLIEEDYKLCSDIAPTIAQAPGSVGWDVTWQDQTTIIGQAVGRTAEAEKLIADTNALYEQAQAEHPNFAGKTALAMTGWPPDWWIRGETDPMATFLIGLGFDYLKQPDGTPYKGIVALAQENLGLLDQVDYIFMNVPPDGGQQTVESDPVFSQTKPYLGGHITFVTDGEDELSWAGAAIILQTPLSLPWVMPRMLPRIEAALEGTAGAPSTTS